jgi:hypothetical protein
MHTTHTTAKGDVFLSSTMHKAPRQSRNRRRPEPPSPLGVWLLIAIMSTITAIITYLLTK